MPTALRGHAAPLAVEATRLVQVAPCPRKAVGMAPRKTTDPLLALRALIAGRSRRHRPHLADRRCDRRQVIDQAADVLALVLRVVLSAVDGVGAGAMPPQRPAGRPLQGDLV